MSLGTYNNANNSKKDYSPVTYSGVRFFNSESTIDPSSMSFSFWKGLLKISIAPIKTGEGSNPEVDKDNSIDIYLTPMKASILFKYISNYNCDVFDNAGVSTNKGIIYITDGRKEFGIPSGHVFIVIKILDQETGSIKSAIAYEFNSSNHYGIVNYVNSNEYEKNIQYAGSAELELFCTVLSTYIESSTYSMAASVVENMKYDVSRLTTRITSIQDHLGIEHGKNKTQYRNGSYFDRNNNVSSSYSGRETETVDSYDNLIDDISAVMND